MVNHRGELPILYVFCGFNKTTNQPIYFKKMLVCPWIPYTVHVQVYNSPFGDGAYGFGPWRCWLTPARSLPRCELSGSYTLNLAHGHGGHGEGVKT